MKSIWIFVFLLIVAYSCDQTSSINDTVINNDSIADIEQYLNNNVDQDAHKVTDLTKILPCYIINVSASKDITEASYVAEELKMKYESSGFIWIPDYKSLSGSEMYASYAGPYIYEGDCIKALRKVQELYPDAYAVLVSNEEVRKEIYHQFDIRYNGRRQDMVLYYADPEEEEAYYEGGGEDWGWFINDVSVYFSKNNKNVFMSSAIDILEQDILNELIEELNIEGFGYILIKGADKAFISHDMPDVVISKVCDFFGYEYFGFDYEDMN